MQPCLKPATVLDVSTAQQQPQQMVECLAHLVQGQLPAAICVHGCEGLLQQGPQPLDVHLAEGLYATCCGDLTNSLPARTAPQARESMRQGT